MVERMVREGGGEELAAADAHGHGGSHATSGGHH